MPHFEIRCLTVFNRKHRISKSIPFENPCELYIPLSYEFLMLAIIRCYLQGMALIRIRNLRELAMLLWLVEAHRVRNYLPRALYLCTGAIYMHKHLLNDTAISNALIYFTYATEPFYFIWKWEW